MGAREGRGAAHLPRAHRAPGQATRADRLDLAAAGADGGAQRRGGAPAGGRARRIPRADQVRGENRRRGIRARSDDARPCGGIRRVRGRARGCPRGRSSRGCSACAWTPDIASTPASIRSRSIAATANGCPTCISRTSIRKCGAVRSPSARVSTTPVRRAVLQPRRRRRRFPRPQECASNDAGFSGWCDRRAGSGPDGANVDAGRCARLISLYLQQNGLA